MANVAPPLLLTLLWSWLRCATGLQIIAVGPPYSVLHPLVAIGQELCRRGHNVTVLSFGQLGKGKVDRYSAACPLQYVSMGEPPVDEEEKERRLMPLMAEVGNDTVAAMKIAATQMFSKQVPALAEGLQRVFSAGLVGKPDFAMVSPPFGSLTPIFKQFGVDFTVVMPTVALPPLPVTAVYVAPPFIDPPSIHDTTFVERLQMASLSSLVYYARHVGAGVFGYGFGFMPEFDPTQWWGRLVLVNSFPGLDYPQPLPPLVQYVGPILDVEVVEPLPADIQHFLDQWDRCVYVSFGTMVHLSAPKVLGIVAALTSEDFCVLWALPKLQQEGLPASLPRNFFVHHWVPGPAALAHPHVAAFVSHCGGNSAAEAAVMGKPVVGYPQFGDQVAVCRRIADFGAGRARPVASWVQAEDVREVLASPIMAAKARTLSRLARHYGGAGRAADLVELAAAGDLGSLRLPSERSWADWWRYTGHEFAAVALAAAIVSCLALRAAGRCCVRCCCKRRPGRATAEKKAA